MPFTRITLRKGKSPAYLAALSESLHQALVESFDVPADDRFQAIHQLDAHELIYDRHYLAGPRSDNYVVIDITIGRPRSADTKRAFYRRLVERLAASPGIRPEDVMVFVTPAQREDWSLGNGIAQMLEPTAVPETTP